MERRPCFIYREGEHFRLPPKFDDAPPKLCDFAALGAGGHPQPHPQVFYPVADPAEAAFFLFPYDIGHYVDALMAPQMEALIGALPYYAGRETRHIICDGGDLTAGIDIPACLFKISLTRQNAHTAVGNWYDLPAHSAGAKPAFNWGEIRHDCSFVGNITSPARQAALLSLRHEAADLRLKIDLDDSLYLEGGYYFSREQTSEQKSARQELYLEATRRSLTVLCPPGIGPHSLRMYETMHLGRIPVIFGAEAVYPFADEIDYSAFCLAIPSTEIMHTGRILKEFLAAHAPEKLHEMCALACKTWNTRLAPQKKLPALLAAAARKYGF